MTKIIGAYNLSHGPGTHCSNLSLSLSPSSLLQHLLQLLHKLPEPGLHAWRPGPASSTDSVYAGHWAPRFPRLSPPECRAAGGPGPGCGNGRGVWGAYGASRVRRRLCNAWMTAWPSIWRGWEAWRLIIKFQEHMEKKGPRSETGALFQDHWGTKG